MALQKQLNQNETNVGMSAAQAYLKISGLNILDNYVTIEVHGYASQEARQNNAYPILVKQYIAMLPDVTGTGNLLEICYAYLKTLDDFSVSSDV